MLSISRGGDCEGFLGRHLFVFSSYLEYVLVDYSAELLVNCSNPHFISWFQILGDNSLGLGDLSFSQDSFEGLQNDKNLDKISELVFPSKGIRPCWDTTPGETPETRPTGTIWYAIKTLRGHHCTAGNNKLD